MNHIRVPHFFHFINLYFYIYFSVILDLSTFSLVILQIFKKLNVVKFDTNTHIHTFYFLFPLFYIIFFK